MRRPVRLSSKEQLMFEIVVPLAEFCAALIESIGVTIIATGAVLALVNALRRRLAGVDGETVYDELRQRLGRGILIGLEFLVAADIIHTVAVELNLETVATLAIIVLIRTFLSFALEVEITGRWPWQDQRSTSATGTGDG
jgi:uncharacterized membrane protein